MKEPASALTRRLVHGEMRHDWDRLLEIGCACYNMNGHYREAMHENGPYLCRSTGARLSSSKETIEFVLARWEEQQVSGVIRWTPHPDCQASLSRCADYGLTPDRADELSQELVLTDLAELLSSRRMTVRHALTEDEVAIVVAWPDMESRGEYLYLLGPTATKLTAAGLPAPYLY